MGNENRIDLTPGMVQDNSAVATETILPGSLITKAAGGYSLRGAGAETGPVMVAGTSPERGIGTRESYVNGEALRELRPAMGQVVNVILAVSQTVVVGDDLAAAAGGEVVQSSTNAILQAEESVTTGAGATALIRATPKQA